MIPTLETERLVLRAPEARDFDAFAAFFTTERSRFVGGPRSRGLSWRSFAAVIGHWHLRGYGMWSLEARDGGGWIGMVGLWYPEDWIAREIGWWIGDPAAEGRGLAREAALAARAHAYDALGWTEAFSVIDPDNARSIALATRLGCTLDRSAVTEDGQPVLVWRHPSPETHP
jgi:ribosomal-protein-alanine N-acetyltransferase